MILLIAILYTISISRFLFTSQVEENNRLKAELQKRNEELERYVRFDYWILDP